MAELAALGVVANIVQFLELGLKASISIVSTYRSITDDGLLPRLVDLKAMAEDLQRRCVRLQADADIKMEAGMKSLLQRCIKTAKELVDEASGLTIVINGRSLSGIQERLSFIKAEILERLQTLLFLTKLMQPLSHHRRELSDHVGSLGDASAAWNRATNARLDQLAKDVGRLLESTNDAASATQLERISATLSRFAEEAKHQGNVLQILKSLKFAQIVERQTEIPKAHQNTFEWIFHENVDVNFASWLQASNGIFWVTGKPGSGKSTLMKFISGHETTSQLGNLWASPRQLVVASHFFWGIRSGLQSSQEGLLRTLLFQIMVQCPEIIPDVCRERYTSTTYALNSWTIETLLDAFERLRSIRLPSKRILVFIDGLDEYKGDHRDLVKFLTNTSQSYDIKICCASRHWRVFEDAYGNLTTRIQMDRLTATDMAIYVRDALGQHEHYQCLLRTHEAEATKLIESISQKSEGVFFWVALVVKSLVRGLDNWDDVGILQKRVSELPSDLDEFFQRMLDSIEDVYRETAYRTFSMLLIADMPVPVVCFLIMDTYFDNMMSFKSTDPFRSLKSKSASATKYLGSNLTAGTEFQPDDEEGLYRHYQDPDHPKFNLLIYMRINHVERQSRLEYQVLNLTRKRDQILAQCRDLVQSWEVQTQAPTNLRVGFLHRTVVEFLQRSKSARSRIPLKHQRYWLARSFAEFDAQLRGAKNGRDVDRDFLFRFLYTTEQAEPHDILASLPGLARLCEQMMDMWRGEVNVRPPLETIWLVSQVWARAFLAMPTTLSSSPHRNFYLFTAMRSILKGSMYVEVGDFPDVVQTHSVDLPVLRDLLSWVNFTGDDPDMSYPFKNLSTYWSGMILRHGARIMHLKLAY
ncbi:hypothetical protein BDP55DRAFT_633937 [Colletotrichum godetiae]|uniref:Nephrocystin 3-like N-terminal domain-containing protein n=1 Tax=Colletotrichum godetiae TaxID=1209918 RepID=A0AAJ0AJN0_9PEZI|nr:uncharacterized protein BDP55DRAFT_633937 [Colletotrichum godetiae]KAK1673663.1 hypothetical protein BDP55DRAFT_633937 [Colletotrichum godetiae]